MKTFRQLREDLENNIQEEIEGVDEIVGTAALAAAAATAAASLKKYGKSNKSLAQRVIDTAWHNKHRDKEGAKIAQDYVRQQRSQVSRSKSALKKAKTDKTKAKHKAYIDKSDRAKAYAAKHSKKSYIDAISPKN